MDNPFHYDPADYHAQVAHIAERVVSNDDTLRTVAPRINVDSNSYHASAITAAERDRLSRLYPRLHR